MATVGGVSISGSSSVTMNECDAAAENTHVFDDPYEGAPEPRHVGTLRRTKHIFRPAGRGS